jgi:hypothetical protein
MAKARPDHTTTADDPDIESDDFKALALRREWKQRLRDLIETYYYKTPLKERQWWKLQEIADECARVPGTTKIDDMVDFLCRAIFRGEFEDDKGRMQVANLHFSPLAPMRLDVKSLAFDQLLKLADDLFVRRKECIECLSRNNIDVPRAWLPSDLAGASAPANDHKPPPVEERWPISDEPPLPQERKLRHAWIIAHQIWEGAPPRSWSIRKITDRMTQQALMNAADEKSTGMDAKHENRQRQEDLGFSDTTVRRLLKKKP